MFVVMQGAQLGNSSHPVLSPAVVKIYMASVFSSAVTVLERWLWHRCGSGRTWFKFRETHGIAWDRRSRARYPQRRWVRYRDCCFCSWRGALLAPSCQLSENLKAIAISKPSELPLWVQIRYEAVFCSQYVSYQEAYTVVRDLGPNCPDLGVCSFVFRGSSAVQQSLHFTARRPLGLHSPERETSQQDYCHCLNTGHT